MHRAFASARHVGPLGVRGLHSDTGVGGGGTAQLMLVPVLNRCCCSPGAAVPCERAHACARIHMHTRARTHAHAHSDAHTRTQIKELEDDLARSKAAADQLRAEVSDVQHAMRRMEVRVRSVHREWDWAGWLAMRVCSAYLCATTGVPTGGQ